MKERLMQQWNMKIDPKLSIIRRHLINNTDFSIVCNNCWGGYVYRRYGLEYSSPTVGLFFMAKDYIKFCRSLRHYLQDSHLEFISGEESRHRKFYEENKCLNRPIGLLDDIEIVFLHYQSEEEARNKWIRRAERVNYDNLIFKFSQMNCCTQEELKEFDMLDANKKVMFISGKTNDYKCAISIQEKGDIINDTTYYSKYISIENMINSEICHGNYMTGIYQKK